MPSNDEPARDAWSPEAAERIIDESVITPRVLDEAAFGAFAGRLQELIHQAVRKGQGLRDATADAERFTGETRRSETELRKKLELAAKLLSGLDERTRRIEQAAARTEDLSALGERLDAIAAERADAAERRFRETIERYDAQIRERSAMIEALELRAAEAEATLVAAEAQHDQQIAATAERCEAMIAKAEHARETLEQHLGEVLERVDRQAAELQSVAEPIHASVNGAFEALGIDPARPGAGSKLDEMAERTASLAERLDTSERAFRALTGLAEEARGSLGKTIQDASERMDELEARCEALAGPLAERARGLAHLTPELIASASAAAGEVETLRQDIAQAEARLERAGETLTNHAGQMEALTHGSLRQINERVEQAGAWLAGLIKRAEQAGTGLGDTPRAPERTPAPAPASVVAEPKAPRPTPQPERPTTQRIEPRNTDATNPAPTTLPSDGCPGEAVENRPSFDTTRSDASRVAAAPTPAAGSTTGPASAPAVGVESKRSLTSVIAGEGRETEAGDQAVAVLDAPLPGAQAEPKPERKPADAPTQRAVEAATETTMDAVVEPPLPAVPTPLIRPLDAPLDAEELTGPVVPVRPADADSPPPTSMPSPISPEHADGSASSPPVRPARPSPLLNRIADDHKIRFDRG